MDDLMPNDGTYFAPKVPEEQKSEIDTENIKAKAAEPVINDLIERFKERISYYKSVDSVDSSVLTVPDEFMHVIAANKIVAESLAAELDHLEGLLKQ